MKLKTDGTLGFGQVPALEVKSSDGTIEAMLFQSAAIIRYLGKIGGRDLYPSDPIAAARVDAILDQEADAFMGLRVSRYKERFGFSSETILTEKATEAVRKEINRTIIPRHMGFMEKLLKSGATGWLAGTKEPSVADFFWYPTFEALKLGWSDDETILDDFPEILKFMAKFEKLMGLNAAN